MTEGDQLAHLLGRTADDPDVLDALKRFDIRWPPVLDPVDPESEAEPDWYVWRPSSRRGFEFGFQDQAHLYALPVDQRGTGPLVLSHVIFYGEHEGVLPYEGELPYELHLTDSREHVRQVLSALGEPRSHRRDVWEPDPHRVVVEHVPSGERIDSVMLKLRLASWEPPAPAPPSLQDLVDLFGVMWYAPRMRELLVPFGLNECGSDIAIHGYADLRRALGLELYFSPDPGRLPDDPTHSKGAELTGIKLFRSRYQDAKEWEGGLPSGLLFDLAYPDIVEAVGRQPDEGADGNLSGYALWHLEAFTLHVFYDNVDNVIFCLSLFEKGSWVKTGD